MSALSRLELWYYAMEKPFFQDINIRLQALIMKDYTMSKKTRICGGKLKN